MNIDNLRTEIDRIDQQLLELFLKRMDIVKQVAQYKIDNELPVIQLGREDEILKRISQQAGDEMAPHAVSVFRQMLEASKELQQDLMLD